jgi:hypothetical protein
MIMTAASPSTPGGLVLGRLQWKYEERVAPSVRASMNIQT